MPASCCGPPSGWKAARPDRTAVFRSPTAHRIIAGTNEYAVAPSQDLGSALDWLDIWPQPAARAPGPSLPHRALGLVRSKPCDRLAKADRGQPRAAAAPGRPPGGARP